MKPLSLPVRLRHEANLIGDFLDTCGSESRDIVDVCYEAAAEIERLENLALEDDNYRCDKCLRVLYMTDFAHIVTSSSDDSETICKECAK